MLLVQKGVETRSHINKRCGNAVPTPLHPCLKHRKNMTVMTLKGPSYGQEYRSIVLKESTLVHHFFDTANMHMGNVCMLV